MLDAPASRDDAVVQAIYGVRSARADSGLVRRIEPAGHPARFERRVGDNHHRLVGRGCGRTDLEPVDKRGSVIDEARSVSWGLCPACQEAGGSTAGRHIHEEEWQ